MAENFVSRIILQDGFSQTKEKYKQAATQVVSATQKMKGAVSQASGVVGKFRGALSSIKGTHKTEVKAVGLGAVEKNVASIQSQIERLTNKPAVITAKTQLTRSDIRQAKSEVKELERQLKDLSGQKYKVDLELDGQQIQTLAVSSRVVWVRRCRWQVGACLPVAWVQWLPVWVAVLRRVSKRCGRVAMSASNI